MPYITSIERLAKEEGHEEGMRLGLSGIRAALGLGFGSAGLALMPRVEAIKSVDKLQRLTDSLVPGTSLEQFKKLLRKIEGPAPKANN